MPKKQVTLTVESSGYDIMEAVALVIGAIKGGQGIEAAIAALSTVVQDFGAIVPDVKEDLPLFLKGINLAGYDIAAVLLGKPIA